MNDKDAESILKALGAIWRQPLAPDQVVAWAETLFDLQPAHARAAVRALKDTNDFLPSHAEFLRAYGIAKRRADEAHQAEMEGKPGGARCTCDYGWVEVEQEKAGQLTVRRCPRCRPPEERKSEELPASFQSGAF